jgi:hypothetical protein
MNTTMSFWAEASWWPTLITYLDSSGAFLLFIPIAGILVGGIIAVTKLLIRHRERMAMIDRGMYPDNPPQQGESADEAAPTSQYRSG